MKAEESLAKLKLKASEAKADVKIKEAKDRDRKIKSGIALSKEDKKAIAKDEAENEEEGMNAAEEAARLENENAGDNSDVIKEKAKDGMDSVVKKEIKAKKSHKTKESNKKTKAELDHTACDAAEEAKQANKQADDAVKSTDENRESYIK